MIAFLRRFVRNESGATAIEYGLIAALVSVAAITALTNVGDQVKSAFEKVETALSGEGGAKDPPGEE